MEDDVSPSALYVLRTVSKVAVVGKEARSRNPVVIWLIDSRPRQGLLEVLSSEFRIPRPIPTNSITSSASSDAASCTNRLQPNLSAGPPADTCVENLEYSRVIPFAGGDNRESTS